jgi:hypothetical protein
VASAAISHNKDVGISHGVQRRETGSEEGEGRKNKPFFVVELLEGAQKCCF